MTVVFYFLRRLEVTGPVDLDNHHVVNQAEVRNQLKTKERVLGTVPATELGDLPLQEHLVSGRMGVQPSPELEHHD